LVFKQNEGVIIISKDCVDIISTSADPTRNFFRVRFRNPKLFVGGKYSTPQWGQKAAMTIGTKYYGVKGCKITMAQPVGGRWMIQNVLIPKNGGVEMTEELALQIANHIQDRIEREGQWTAVMCRDNETKRYISKINGRHIERDERGRFAPHAAEEFDAEFKGKEGVWLYRYPLSYRPNEQAITVFKDKEDWLPIWEKLCEDYIQIRHRESLEVFERQMQEKREDFPHLSDNELEEQFPTSFAYWKRQTIQIPQAIDDMVVKLNQEGDERGVYSIDLGKKRYNPSGYHINNAHTITYNDYHAFVFYPFGDDERMEAEEFEADEFEADTRKYLGVWVQKQGDKHYYLDLDDIFGELRYVPNWKAHGWEHPYWDLEIKGGRARFVKSFNEGVKAFRDEALNMKQTEEFDAEQTQYDVKKGKNGIDYESANYISLHDTFAEAEAVAKRERKNLNDDEVIFIVEESFDDETFALDTNLLLSMGKSQTKETSSDSSFDAEEFEAQQFYNNCSTNQFEIFGRNLFYKCSNLGSVRSQKLTSFSDGGLGSYQGGDYALRLAGGMKKYDVMNTLAEVSQDMQPSSMNDWKEVVSATNQIISAEMAQRRMKS
jgi:hypothetical protein